MRRLTVKLELKPVLKAFQGKMFDVIKEIRLVDFIKIDYKRGTKLAVIEIELIKNHSFDDIVFPLSIEILEVFHTKGNTVRCLMKNKIPKEILKFARMFDFDVIYTQPSMVTSNYAVFSCIGSEKDLQNFFNRLKIFANIKSTSYSAPDYKEVNIYSTISKKHQEVLHLAYSLGYYKYPREIKIEQLSKILKCSKSTLTEHLRKVENKLVNQIMYNAGKGLTK